MWNFHHCSYIGLLCISQICMNAIILHNDNARIVTLINMGGGPRVVVSTAAFHARVRGSVPGLGGLKENKIVSSPSTCESQYCGEPRISNPVSRTVSSQSSHHPQEVLLAQFSLYVHKGGLKSDSFHFSSI